MDLPVPLQLAIVDAMSTYLTVGLVFKRLQVTPLELRKTLRQLHDRRDRKLKENSSIDTMHEAQLHLLLHGQADRPDALTRAKFRETFDEHLYKNINVEQDYHTITRKDLGDARTYLRRIGLNPDLAGEWSAMDDHDLGKQSQSMPNSEPTTGQSAGTTLRLRLSMPSEVSVKPFAGTKHPVPTSPGRRNATMPVKRVLFATGGVESRSTGLAANANPIGGVASTCVLPPSSHQRQTRHKKRRSKRVA